LCGLDAAANRKTAAIRRKKALESIGLGEGGFDAKLFGFLRQLFEALICEVGMVQLTNDASGFLSAAFFHQPPGRLRQQKDTEKLEH